MSLIPTLLAANGIVSSSAAAAASAALQCYDNVFCFRDMMNLQLLPFYSRATGFVVGVILITGFCL